MGFLSDLYAARGRAIPDRKSPYVFGDKDAYLSPLDRTVVQGRTAHREHMRKHDVVEAGDIKIGSARENTPLDAPGKDIKRAIQELQSR